MGQRQPSCTRWFGGVESYSKGKNNPKSSSWHFGVLILYLLVCFREKKLFSLKWGVAGLLLSDTGDSWWICSILNLYDIVVICILADGYLQVEDTSVFFISILITLYNGRHSVSSINICWINKLILIGVWAYVIMFVNLQMELAALYYVFISLAWASYK